MSDKIFANSQVPIRRTVDLLPQVFKTEANSKFMAGVVDPLIQPGVLEKTVGYVGRRYGKTFKASDIYLDTDSTLRSVYQLEPGVVVSQNEKVTNFFDYIDFKNQLKFYGNNLERDDLFTEQDHYSWNPPINWDKFVNYREYYWVPMGPPTVKVAGQGINIVSSYRVRLGDNSSWTLFPDGLTPNPTITLFRGQTYNFNVNAPRNSFYIRSSNTVGMSANYTKGITNAGTQNGKITFTVPYDAPDILYYQSDEEPDRFGTFLISDVESNSKIDIDKEILGKSTYKSSNGVEFTNGLVIEFTGQTIPRKYQEGRWLIEGVGESIKLINFNDLVPPSINQDVPEVFFDNAGFDTEPYDDARSFPAKKDYITINRGSQDYNPWSRYNRWFHKSVLEYAHSFNGTVLDADESSRAKRPIIEFVSNLQLFNHGSVAKQDIDYIDTFTKDVFSTVEGSTGYNVDGEFLFEGARVLFIADTDSWVKNKIYKVTFITHNNKRQISLIEEPDAESILGECVLVKRGTNNAGTMYHFDGVTWTLSQPKTSVNQPPKFDVFDSNGVSFGDKEVYPVSSFVGSELVSYKIGTVGLTDSELGFKLSYLNIDNVGDIQFEFDLDFETFSWQKDQTRETENINKGFYKINLTNFDSRYENGWTTTDKDYLQPIIDAVTLTEATDTIQFNSCEWVEGSREKIIFYIDGKLYTGSFTRSSLNTFVFDRTVAAGSTVTIKAYTDQLPDQGYYEFPLGLERNPLNDSVTEFTFGQATDHLGTMAELADDFIGSFPGTSNLRDLSNFQSKGRRFLKHSGPAALPITLLCSKDTAVVNSIEFAKKSYTEFKNRFISLIDELYYDQLPIDFVDTLMAKLTVAKTPSDPFSDSDMIGHGAFTKLEYVVEDEGIKTFALNEKFDLNSLSRKAVYVYINQQQLLVNTDYTFDKTFGFVTILVPLAEGDKVEIREYLSTSYCFIPATPSSLGIYKKFTPMIYVDDTYQTPTRVIQGHDGSLTVAFNDVRDEIILELEKRIYNNIKREYDENLFNFDTLVGGYYNSPVFSKSEIDSVINREFLQWSSNTNVDYINNTYFEQENSFTYTYSKMSDPTGLQSLPGFWRGVYLWFFDTDRPHQRPWEMLGFSEKPTWWESEYGPAPYTSGNLILWEDLSNGLIKHGPRAGEYDRYKRPGLLDYIPVDGDGNLLSPLDSGLAKNFVLINNKGDFVFGDTSPVEYAWRRSSEYPFALMVAATLLKPFDFITKFLDSNQLVKNKLGQYTNASTTLFTKIDDIVIPVSGETQTSGIINWVMDYLKSKAKTGSALRDFIQGIDVKLSNRVGGFVDQTQQKYLLDSKNPKSSSGSLFIPPENYDIFFNVSTPIFSISYSGVIVEKTNTGWKLFGYDSLSPVFNYYKAVPSQGDYVISVGGVSEGFVNWTPGKFYNNGQIVRNGTFYYRTITSHTAGNTFDQTLFKQLPNLPQVGAVDALKRRNFNKLKLQQLPYGTILNTVQDVVDFLLGYEQYLISTGLVFDQFDTETQVTRDWLTATKEFMFWTKHNWAEGSLLTLSPAANRVEINTGVGVADNLFDTFYDYQIFKSDGTPLQSNYINVNRDIQKISVSTTNTTDGIYFIKINFVLKEHVVVFEDRTVFNDVIYDKPTGYRQDRIKVRGFRTTDWDGDYTSPGFLFDNVDIKVWQPFTDYKLGDIVAYREFYWTSLENQSGSETFDDTKWSKLDLVPTKGLVPNFDYKINQFDDFYDLDSDGVGSSQRSLARHGIGYQERSYLQNIAEDQVSQFKIYQGFIREKGTPNAITKVFGKLSSSESESVTLKEEWAFRVGRFGGVDQVKEYEFSIRKEDFEINPQPILYVNSIGNEVDSYVRISKSNFTIAPEPYTTNINPLESYKLPGRYAGYVKNDQVKFVVKNKDDILALDISQFNDNDHVWVTFAEQDWTVLRYNTSDIRITPILDESTELDQATPFIKEETQLTIGLSGRHNILIGDIVGIKNVTNLTGFFKVTGVGQRTITVEISADADDPVINTNSLPYISLFAESRFTDYADLELEKIGLLKNGARLWVDNNGNNRWEVIEKTTQYSSLAITEYGVVDPVNVGSTLLYSDPLKQIIAGIPNSNLVVSYNSSRPTLAPTQFIQPPADYETAVDGVFGESLAISPDSKWLIVGSPKASGVNSRYQGEFDPVETYQAGDIVLYNNVLWKAKALIVGDGSTINLDSDYWELETISRADINGTNAGYTEQGMISIYEWGGVDLVSVPFSPAASYPRGSIVSYLGQRYVSIVAVTVPGTLPTDTESWIPASGRWNNVLNLVSPRQAAFERFGKTVTVSKSGNEYFMAVSSEDNAGTGKVYLYKYDGTNWGYLQVQGYSGAFDSATYYPAGSIVWYNNNLYRSLVDQTEVSPEVTETWEQLEDVPVQNILPSSLAVDDSSINSNFLGVVGDDIAEIVKEGDKFGHSLSMSGDSSIMVIGAPYSDGQYFENYKGLWEAIQSYNTDDHVRLGNVYYKSTIDNNQGNDPLSAYGWTSVSTVDFQNLGKVFVYQKNAQGKYKLTQTISKDVFQTNNPLEILEQGDLFGYALDIDATGNVLVISAPFADRGDQDQGSVYVFQKNSVTGQFVFVQKLESFETINNQNFGNSISINDDASKIVIGAQNTPYILDVTFDSGKNTVFDSGKTRFAENRGTAGSVYVFEKKNNVYVLGEKLNVELKENESFGATVDISNTSIVVGSPTFTNDDGAQIGKLRFFTKVGNSDSWKVLATQEPLVKISALTKLGMYDPVKNVKLADVDIIDPFKGKILSQAEQELKFKTPYDPAIYIIGTEDQTVDPDQAWFEKNVGMLWWNVSTAKWSWYEQGDVAYRTGNWGQQVVGSSIDVYEWVETLLLPSEWAAIADTAEGLADGISGQPLHPNDTVYNFKEKYNTTTGQITEVKYYYWVKNKNVLPNNPQRRITAAEVAALINNPIGSGQPIIALIDSDKILGYNLSSLIVSDRALINFVYTKTNKNINLVHSEYQLIAEGDANSVISRQLETKWIDSLIGFDAAGNQVPDPNLSAKQKYGIEFRPRQSMFIDRSKALRIAIDRVNSILTTRPFTEFLDFTNLNKVNPVPDQALNLYDQAVDTFIDLETVGTARISQAVLRANIIDGQVDTIDIIDQGFGYRVAPPVEILGTGTGARAQAVIDNQGRVVRVDVLQKGKKYNSVTLRVRSFSVLVRNDSTSNNFWTIYSWDSKSKVFYRSKTQEFNTPKYWYYTDWWASGYGITSRVVAEVPSLYMETEVAVDVGDLLRVKEYGNGGWAVFERVATGGEILNKYRLVGRQNGTIQLKPELYNLEINNVGYDNKGSYDSIPYDQQPINELRNIFAAIKNDIFADDLAVEWNKLFFSSVGYAFSEQLYVDWAFKTSFMTAVHNVGDLNQKPTYKSDNLDSFKEYIEEVKPYRTKIREYTSQYTEYQSTDTNVTDFDNAPVYSAEENKVINVGLDSEEINQYPRKFWLDNRSYSITDIIVYNSGSEYTNVPRVLIESDSGSGAEAVAYISNGRVSGIKLISGGSGYLTAPKVSLVGGNGTGKTAKAVAILGDGKVRSFDVSIKFDRISKQGIYSNLSQEETFVASGTTSAFDLTYAPTRDKSKISVTINNEVILNSDYQINLYISSTDTYGLIKGKLIFNSAPAKGNTIKVVYEKNDLLLDATNRIEKLYAPEDGMLGYSAERTTIPVMLDVTASQLIEVKSSRDIIEGMRVSGTGVVPCRVLKVTSSSHIVLSEPQTLKAGAILELSYSKPNQLMTGIDFGGVQIQGNPFEVTGGWDALPWFTDGWDSVESNNDYYYVADGSTGYVSLPYTPADGQKITIYLQRQGSTRAIRIDDPNWDDSTLVTNPDAIMPTFVGTGDTRLVDLPNSLDINDGDILIFRTEDSDGTVIINDPNLIDTVVTGGTLETIRGAYSTATGRTAEEIIVEGEKFISPDQVPAPEENVPGQVLDSVSIKVFHSKRSGAPTMMAKVSPARLNQTEFNIGQEVVEIGNVFVYVDRVKNLYGQDYNIDFAANTVVFNSPVTEGSIVEIVSVGIGGQSILDYQEFVADGDTRLFLTNANYNDTAQVLLTVNGNYLESSFSNSRGRVNEIDKTLVETGLAPEANSVVKIVVLGSSLDTDTNQEPLVRVNQQTIIVDASTRTYTVDNFVDLNRSSARGSVLVELNGKFLKSSDTTYVVYDGTNFINLGTDPETQPGTIAINDLKVYKNNELLEFLNDWTFDGTSNTIQLIPTSFEIGDKVRIEQNINTDYSIENGLLTINDAVTLVDGDVITVTWFNEYPTVDLLKEVYSGGKSQYTLARKPISISYLWVYLNGDKLTADVDYILNVRKNVVVLLIPSQLTDIVEIVQFGNDVFSSTVAFEIFEDMLNNTHYKRYSINQVVLTQPLNYYDTSLVISDASGLPTPAPERRAPGVIEINGEKIEYFKKDGNTLSQLRRGTLGTAIAEIHAAGSKVVNIGASETIPYKESQEKIVLISDGSTFEFGPYDFISDQSTSNREFYKITVPVKDSQGKIIDTLYPSIPKDYEVCDEVEIFVGGKRLNKNSVKVYEENLGASSPTADINQEAEFSVNRETKMIRLTNPVPAGIQITIIRKTGSVWYEGGETSASKGVTMLDNDTVIINFIEKKSTLLP